MKWFPLILLLACAGCTVTARVSSRWTEPGPNPDVALREQHQKLTAAVQAMTQELNATTNEINAVNAVLRKYGIQRP